MAAASSTVQALLITDRPSGGPPTVDALEFLTEGWYAEQLCCRRWKGVEWDEASDAAGVARCLAAKAYQAVVVVDMGEAKPFEKKYLPHLALYAKKGGSVAFPTTQGAAAASVVAEFFGLSWKAMPGSARRVRLAPCGQPGRLAVQKHLGVPAEEVDGAACAYPARVVCLQTPAADACLGPADGSRGAAVAVAACGEGRVAFFGDVSGERATALLVEGFVRAAADPMTAEVLVQIIEKNHAGRKLFQAKSYAAALEVFKAGLKVLTGKAGGPKAQECIAEKVKVLATMAECYLRKDRFAEAVDCATQALELDPSSSKSRLRRADALMKLGNRNDEAAKDLVHLSERGSSEEAHTAETLLGHLGESVEGEANGKMTAEVLAAVISKKNIGNKEFQADAYVPALHAYKEAVLVVFKMIHEKAGGPKAKECTAEYVKVLSNMAECYLRLREYTVCVEHATAALDVDASHSKSRLRRAKAYIGGNQRDEAMKDLSHVIKDGGSAAHEAESILARLKADVAEDANASAQGPMTAQVLAQMIAKKDAGNELFQKESYGRAVAQYQAALEVLAGKTGGPKTTECAAEKVKVLSNMAECYLRLQKYTKCVTSATAALNVDASHSKSRLRRAKAHIELNSELEETRQDLTQVIKEGGAPGQEAESILARLKADVAEDASASAQGLHPMTAQVLAQMIAKKDAGNELFHQESYGRAVAQYQAALEVLAGKTGGPKATECTVEKVKVLSNMAECYLRLQKYTKCVASATAALDVDASHSKSRLRRATAQVELGALEEARQDLTQVIKEGGAPGQEAAFLLPSLAASMMTSEDVLADVVSMREEGDTWLQQKKYQSALAQYDMALETMEGRDCVEEYVKVMSGMAECYLQLRDYDKCVAAASKALDLNASNVKNRLRRCEALMALGRHNDTLTTDLAIAAEQGGWAKAEVRRIIGDVAQKGIAEDAKYTGPMTAQVLAHLLERKEQGNALFTAGQYNCALVPYEEAVDIVRGKAGGPKAKECLAEKAKVLSNMAECYLRLQQYGHCLAFAAEALDVDETHTKSRLRRAKALIALNKDSNDAVDDLVQVIKEGGVSKNEAERLLAGLEVDRAARMPKRSQRPSS